MTQQLSENELIRIDDLLAAADADIRRENARIATHKIDRGNLRAWIASLAKCATIAYSYQGVAWICETLNVDETASRYQREIDALVQRDAEFTTAITASKAATRQALGRIEKLKWDRTSLVALIASNEAVGAAS